MEPVSAAQALPAPALPAPAPVRDARSRGTRIGALAAPLVAASLLALCALLGLAGPAAATPPSDVEVLDTAAVLDEASLTAALEDLDFHRPVDLVVLTLDGGEAANLNEAVLAHARAEHPEWLSEDGRTWADGVFILAVDPVGRHVGTYAGEDLDVSQSTQDDIQEASKDRLRVEEWDAGVLAGAEEAASRIGRPWYRSPAPYILLGVAAVAGGTVGAAVASTRGRNRRRVEEALDRGDAHLASVASDLDATERDAARIPTTSPHGRAVLERYRSFADDWTRVRSERAALEALDPAARSRSEAAERAEAWADDAARLDSFDDVVADTADLLTTTGEWLAAWQRQADGLRADLEEAPGIVDLEPAAADGPEATALLEFAGRARVDLSTIGSRLGARQITPDLALDELQGLRTGLSDRFEAYAEAVIEAYAESDDERDTLREQMAESRRSADRPHAGILEVSHPATLLLHSAVFTGWYTAGTSAVDAARGSGTATGYGPTGGGFSGTGSSSSF